MPWRSTRGPLISTKIQPTTPIGHILMRNWASYWRLSPTKAGRESVKNMDQYNSEKQPLTVDIFLINLIPMLKSLLTTANLPHHFLFSTIKLSCIPGSKLPPHP